MKLEYEENTNIGEQLCSLCLNISDEKEIFIQKNLDKDENVLFSIKIKNSEIINHIKQKGLSSTYSTMCGQILIRKFFNKFESFLANITEKNIHNVHNIQITTLNNNELVFSLSHCVLFAIFIELLISSK